MKSKLKSLAIKHTKFFKVPIDPKAVFPDFIPPQSFYYFDDALINFNQSQEEKRR